MGNRVLILMSGFFAGESYYMRILRSRGVNVEHSLRPINRRILRALRRIHFKLRLPGQTLWFGGWAEAAECADVIIVHASDLSIPVVRHLKRVLPDKRVISWYWNPAAKGTNPQLLPNSVSEKWSFDPADCQRFEMNFNSTYSFAEVSAFSDKRSVDLLFVGANKGRAEQLEELAILAIKSGLTAEFRIVGLTPDEIERFPHLIADEEMDYESLLRLSGRARVLVDVVQKGQTGLSLRAVEAVYLGCKLLTTNRSVVEEPLYDPTRIFVLGSDDLRNLPEFVNCVSNPIPKQLLRYYDFDEWLSRFN